MLRTELENKELECALGLITHRVQFRGKKREFKSKINKRSSQEAEAE